MPRSPIKNLLIVLSLLAVMAGTVMMVTNNRSRAASPSGVTATDPLGSSEVRVDVHMLFSHRPQRVIIEGHHIDMRPAENTLQFTLALPAGQITELPLDIIWGQAAETANACYFIRTTTRQSNKEDDITHLVTHDTTLADVLTIDTHE